jgi:hypothetical protein
MKINLPVLCDEEVCRPLLRVRNAAGGVATIAGQQYSRRPYWWQWFNTAVAANATITNTPQQLGDYDFEWIFLEGSYTSAQALLQILEGASQVPFMGGGQFGTAFGGILLANCLGTAQNPFPVGLEPYVIPKGQIMTVTVTDQSGSQNTIIVNAFGYKLVPVSQSGS